MIPLHLSLSGFLSYRQPVELDFTQFDLACISGLNGAGKSSLLDAITWALFGKARQRDEALIHTHPDVQAAKVVFTFAYEENTYRVQRIKRRGKSTLLEFHILQSDGVTWKPFTERTSRETQNRIQQTLRLDYETFVNAAFFLQGKADQFTQQTAGKRKEILSSILGLEIWDTYKNNAREQRAEIENQCRILDTRLQDIRAELAEGPQRRKRLKQLKAQLDQLAQSRQSVESALGEARKSAAALKEQRNLLNTLARQMQSVQKTLDDLKQRQTDRQTQQQTHQQLLAQAEQIRQQYQQWEKARAALAQWEQTAAQFQEQQLRRQKPLEAIAAEKARLEEERRALQQKNQQISALQAEIEPLQAEQNSIQAGLTKAEEKLAQRAALHSELQQAQKQLAEARAENPRLKQEMNELKARIDQLEASEGAACPLCGQPLSPEEHQSLITEYRKKGTAMGDRYRNNLHLLEQSKSLVDDIQTQISALSPAEEQARQLGRQLEGLGAQIVQKQAAIEQWQQQEQPRLQQIENILETEEYAPQARARLEQIDRELQAIGYDTAEHDRVRRNEQTLRSAGEQMRALDKAEGALEALGSELADLRQQIRQQQKTFSRLQQEHDAHAATLAAAEAQAPDLRDMESTLLNLQEQEGALRMEMGAARQNVDVLRDLKSRQSALEAERQTLTQTIDQLKTLERAFGKDGVPALLIEQALPQIENKANQILERLSGGGMNVRFLTQKEYKDKKRADLKETLEIQISDNAGTRAYEMYSGGEAFRVNFAIRLALSEVLARRAGARLQTLVIDEGFGSQDAQGRQRLVEAINSIKGDFAKILVITHVEELKDVFPALILVEKGPQGSMISIR